MGMSGELSMAQLLESEVARARSQRLFSHVASPEITNHLLVTSGVESVRDLDDSSKSFTSKSPGHGGVRWWVNLEIVDICGHQNPEEIS